MTRAPRGGKTTLVRAFGARAHQILERGLPRSRPGPRHGAPPADRDDRAQRAAADRPHPVFARFYAAISPGMELEGMGDLRDELLAGLSGRVVEVGAGNGLNLARYPATVTEVVAVEPEPHLRRLAKRAAREAPVPVTVVPGTAERLPLAGASVDAGVVSLVLCSVPDPRAALAELHRVIRPDGELRFLEHVRADSAGLRWVQRAADATLWPLLAGGCHTSRDPLGAVAAVGFDIAAVRRLRFPDSRIPVPAAPHILGSARRAA